MVLPICAATLADQSKGCRSWVSPSGRVAAPGYHRPVGSAFAVTCMFLPSLYLKWRSLLLGGVEERVGQVAAQLTRREGHLASPHG